MLDVIWLPILLPLASALFLGAFGGGLSKRVVALFGAGSVGLSAALTIAIAGVFLASPPPGYAHDVYLWDWIKAGGFDAPMALHLDALSLVMMLVVTFVGFLIHLYSVEFMREEEGYSRYFTYMNLFVGSMLTLVLAKNLLLLYLGWEGVGMCSYLLIGYWYDDPANGRAARKAFVVTRVGDAALAIAIFLIFTQLGTLDIQGLMARASENWAVGSTIAIVTAALILGGAVGKSAQLPLQSWLPDAMAGPSPVSALIHAATMVTAGVYLIARTNVLFTLAPPVQFAVAIVGAATLLMSGFAALAQRDIKRVLAYSTISQIGYMFLGLGVGAWAASIFHFMTHAFFKALLFLAAGAVIQAMHHEHDIFKMGGLRHELPVTFWTFLAGGAALAGFPVITAGFYSKDLILAHAFSSPIGGIGLYVAGLVGVVLTAMYTFRMIFIAFYGERGRIEVEKRPGWLVKAPLVVLAFLSVVAGILQIPAAMGNFSNLVPFLQHTLPPMQGELSVGTEGGLLGASSSASILGILFAWVLVFKLRSLAAWLAQTGYTSYVYRLWASGFGFDWVYDFFLVRPYNLLAAINKRDLVDYPFAWIARISADIHRLLSLMQDGHLRWYAAGLTAGAVILLAVVLLR